METYTLPELSKKLGITIYSLRNFIKQGVLPASKVATRYIITEADLKEFLDTFKIKPNEKSKTKNENSETSKR